MRNNFIHHLTTSAFLIFLFTQCTPIPVYRLHPVDNNVFSRWVRGHQILRIEGHKYDAALAFAKQVNTMLAFDVQIINKSNKMISVIPDSIYAVNYAGYYVDSLGHETPLYPTKYFFAHNPEKELMHVDQAAHNEDASYKTDRVVHPIFSLIDAVFDAATSNNQNNQNQDDENDIDYNTYLTRRAIEHSQEIKSLGAQHFQWSTEALRRTDLEPNESIRGLVFITAKPKTSMLGLHLNIAGEDHTIYFRQIQYK